MSAEGWAASRRVLRLVAVAAVLAGTAGGYGLGKSLGADYPPAALRGLPLVEIPAAQPGGDSTAAGLMVVLLTGDGGWAPGDRRLAQQLAARGVPVVGWNSLRYYWTARRPDEAARDLSRIVDFYTRRWDRPRVVLMGYSFGADVLPFLVTRLPPADRAKIAGVTLLGFAPEAVFEFHLPGWAGIDLGPSRPTAPEVRRMLAEGVPVLCINGVEESKQGCPALPGDTVRVVMVPTGHHFGHWYRRISHMVLQGLRQPGGGGPVAAPVSPQQGRGVTR